MAYNGNGYSRGGPGGGGPGGEGSMIHKSKNEDDARKIFVGGISWETSPDDVRRYFETYGAVLDVNMKINPATGRPRGFGFVLFEHASTVDKVVKERNHMLNGKQIDPKRAVAGGSAGELLRKIFVGGIDPNLTEQDVAQHFSQYGKVEHVELPFDKVKNQRRAFGFITFESEDAVNKVCASPKIAYGDKMVDVKRAVTKQELNHNGPRSSGPGGKRGGGSGGGGQLGSYGPPGGGYDYYNGAYPNYPTTGYPGYDYYGGATQAASGYGLPQSGGYQGGYPGYGYGGGYDQSGGYGAPPSGSSSYDAYGGYDYSGGWQGGSESSGYGKMKKGSGEQSSAPSGGYGGGYHPYSR